jgi:hypothetical protein
MKAKKENISQHTGAEEISKRPGVIYMGNGVWRDPNYKSHKNHPFFIKERERAEEFWSKHSLPPEIEERLKREEEAECLKKQAEEQQKK